MITFTEQTGSDNPFNGIDVGTFGNSSPSFGDLDGDGDLDVVFGSGDGDLVYYKNTGSSTNPSYVVQTGSDSPFNGIDVGFQGVPSLGDLDGDGDLDVVIGNTSGTLRYYQNTGTSTNPSYVVQTGSDSPFNGIDVGFDSLPSLTDLDGDGDLDAVVTGTSLSGLSFIRYFENTGSSTNPNYVVQTGSDNPFDGIDDVLLASFGDLDGDGDFDAVIGESGSIRYFENTGSSTSPNYAERTGSDNPFDGVFNPIPSIGGYSPSLADVDGDGDLDAVIGNSGGTVSYYENGTPVIPTNTDPDAVDDEAITNAETVIDINVLDNDTDADGDNLSIDSFDGTSNLGATITENPDGTLSYDPNGQITLALGETVTDSFTYTIEDGNGGTDTATVNLTIFDPSVIIIEGDNEPSLEVGGRTDESLLVLGNENEADLGNGDDTTAVNGDGNVIDAGLGDDEATIIGDDNTISTDLGSDIVEVEGESNTIETGGGIDDIDIIGNNNTVEAGDGNDEIDITGDGTVLDAGDGNDDITVTGDASTVDAGSGNDVIVVVGDDNEIDGGRGNDDITGTGQNLIVDGGNGNDAIIINTDNGTLGAQVTGGSGNDTITGSLADDILLGNQNDDVIDGRDGDDIIEANKGADTLTGGAGSDIFRFGTDAATDDLTNLIVDFEQGTDLLAIEDLDLNEFTTADGGTTYDFSIGRNSLTIAFTNPVTLSATDFTDYQNTFV
ncbi:MAG: FG-GAP-like repeat-containing protein [Cyanobacteria bacterium J06592_8]